MAAVTIVVVEDEASLRRDMIEYLRGCGFDAVGVKNGRELDEQIAARPVSLVVLDVNLPGEDGFKIATRLRENPSIGIIMVTARGSTVDRVVGLELGADAYLVKPVEMRELEAQAKALLRRLEAGNAGAAPPAPPASGPPPSDEAHWVLDATAWALTSPAGVRVSLTSMEMKLVSLLAGQARQPATRDQISVALYNRRWNPDDRSIDTVVGRLRHKVENAIGETAPVKSVHGVGYVFSAPVRMI
ncbi:response regulator transcription factor [Azospirillum isscasi]|uniref:Response regulator transcription factor n=1 Tax=Azospirillum isscasi TaxID=3053926 RepID=A0ABU0WP07_9PROT|nr:response regulator transcription factor [Azospirillum isscasi]MDQ2105562.1 response regulator transcription factor [Azospirillum isscasi]